MKNGINWAEERAADAKWLRREILWSAFALALLTGFGWLFLNQHLIIRFFG